MIVFSIGTDTLSLFYIMILPLIDGAYITVVLTNQLGNIFNSIVIGVSILSGVASVSMAQRINGSKTKKIQNLITIGLTFIILVILSTILAKSLSNALNITRLRVFGSISIILIAFRILMDESNFNRFLRPSVVILLGLIFSLNLNELYFQLNINIELVFNSLISAVSAMILTSTATLVDLPEMEREIDYIASAILFLISLKIFLGI